MEKIKIKAEKRKIFGRKIKQLRKEGLLPANIFGGKVKSLAVQVDLKEFEKVFKSAGETGLVEIKLTDEKAERPSLIHNLQKDPVSGENLHVDFRQVNLAEKVRVAIPIEIIGESAAVAKGGVLIQLMDEIEVEALPTDLPEKFEVSIEQITELGQGIALSCLEYDQKKIKLITEQEDELIVKVEEPKEEKEEEKPEETVEEEEKSTETEGKTEGKTADQEQGKEEKKEAKE